MTKTKFEKNLLLSNPQIKEVRAANTASDVMLAQEALINELKREKNRLIRELDAHYDLYPKTTVDLGATEINPEEWVSKVQATRVCLLETEVKLNIALDTYEEWFTEEKEPARPSSEGRASAKKRANNSKK